MAARKSMQFLYTLFTQTKSKDDIVRDKLKPGKFVFTPSGILCVLGIVRGRAHLPHAVLILAVYRPACWLPLPSS